MEVILKIRPAQGKRIRDPRNAQVLPADRDSNVVAGSYWTRRLAAGDVVQVSEEAQEKPAAKKESKKLDEPEKSGK